jgi:hypothetical protein
MADSIDRNTKPEVTGRRLAKQHGQEHRHPGRDDPIGEADHQWM